MQAVSKGLLPDACMMQPTTSQAVQHLSEIAHLAVALDAANRRHMLACVPLQSKEAVVQRDADHQHLYIV